VSLLFGVRGSGFRSSVCLSVCSRRHLPVGPLPWCNLLDADGSPSALKDSYCYLLDADRSPPALKDLYCYLLDAYRSPSPSLSAHNEEMFTDANHARVQTAQLRPAVVQVVVHICTQMSLACFQNLTEMGNEAMCTIEYSPTFSAGTTVTLRTKTISPEQGLESLPCIGAELRTGQPRSLASSPSRALCPHVSRAYSVFVQ
jgi:hypothetical protein